MDLYFKTAIVFTHFALAAFCFVTIVGMDIKLLRRYGAPASAALCDEVGQVKHAVTYGLLGLWASGLVIVAHGMWASPGYLDNQKLWFKLFVVVALTLNGVLIHRAGRVLQPGVTLAGLDDRSALLLNLAGATSSISWLWACLLGTARAWNGTLSFQTLFVYYLASLVVGALMAIGLHLRARRALGSALVESNDAAYDRGLEDAVSAHQGVMTRE